MEQNNVNQIEKVAEISKKYGSYNVLLAFVITIATACIGSVIWQNNQALNKLGESQSIIATELVQNKLYMQTIVSKVEGVDKKIDLLLLEQLKSPVVKTK